MDCSTQQPYTEDNIHPHMKQRRKRFTATEDEMLKKLVQTYGDDWESIAKYFQGKNTRQLRDRWLYYLDPNLKAAPFTPDEDATLIEKLQELGNKWRLLTSFLPGRTDVALKNRWKMIQRHQTCNAKYQKRKKISPHSSSSISFNQPINDQRIASENIQLLDNYDIFNTFVLTGNEETLAE